MRWKLSTEERRETESWVGVKNDGILVQGGKSDGTLVQRREEQWNFSSGEGISSQRREGRWNFD
jgi:hypothetical protein